MKLIPVALGGKTEYTEEGQPFNPSDVFGFMDDDELEKRTGGYDNENETCNWIEYWDGDVIRHRSVNLILKKGLGIEAAIGDIG